MKPKVSNIALFLVVVGAIFWLGGTNLRVLMGGELLEPGTLNFRQGLTPDSERTIFDLLAKSSILTLISYLVVFVGGIVYLTTAKLSFKEDGWLLMSTILFYLFTPVEFYTGYLDLKSILLWLYSSPSITELHELFLKRVGALSGLPFIALLCYYTAIGVIVFRPFRKKPMQTVTQ
jgi:ABC-type cobalamin transport system permease subunit